MNIFILAGQFIVGLVFVVAVVSDFLDRNILMSTLDNKLEILLKRKIPQTQFLFYGALVLKAICGLALMFNILASVAAFFLAGFTIIANVIFNNFWTVRSDERKSVFLLFLIHWAVIGGLIVLIGV